MDVREMLEREAMFEPSVRQFVRNLNKRLSLYPSPGEFWVRVRPPTVPELRTGDQQPKLVKFYQVGSLVEVVETLVDFVEIVCSGSTLLVNLEDFYGTWIRLNTWSNRRTSHPPGEQTEVLL